MPASDPSATASSVQRLFMVLSIKAGGSSSLIPALTTMGKVLTRFTRNEGRLSLQFGQSFPCPLTEGAFSAIKTRNCARSLLSLHDRGGLIRPQPHQGGRGCKQIMPSETILAFTGRDPSLPKSFSDLLSRLPSFSEEKRSSPFNGIRKIFAPASPQGHIRHRSHQPPSPALIPPTPFPLFFLRPLPCISTFSHAALFHFGVASLLHGLSRRNPQKT